jgi:hypothetical protein
MNLTRSRTRTIVKNLLFTIFFSSIFALVDHVVLTIHRHRLESQIRDTVANITKSCVNSPNMNATMSTGEIRYVEDLPKYCPIRAGVECLVHGSPEAWRP